MLERSQAQEMQYKQDARSAMMGGVMGAAQIASVMPWDAKSGTTKDKTINPKSTQQVTSQYIPPIDMGGVYNLGLGTAQTSIPGSDVDFTNTPVTSLGLYSQTGGIVPGITTNTSPSTSIWDY